MLNRLCALLALFAAAAPASAQPPAAEGTPIVTGTSYAIASRHLGGRRTINIRLPAGYERQPQRRWPVLYLLDGGVEQDFPHIAGIAQHADISWTFEPFILVGIESQRRPFELTFPATDERYGEVQRPNGGADAMRAFLREEVRPFVEGRVRASGEDIVMGESLAGLFVVETLLRAPDLFDSWIAISPSLWWNRGSLLAEAPALLPRHDARPRRLYLTVANEGGTHRSAIDGFVAALDAHAPAGLDWRFVDRSAAETHGSIYHAAALDALRGLYPIPYREGHSPRTPWLHDGPLPPLGAEAQRSLDAGECTAGIARRTTLAEIAANEAYWRGMCVIVEYGAGLPERRRRR
ncbi:MAG TPA: alpha/beta hydrolase-fold protein [Allosphingosinicella sp.]